MASRRSSIGAQLHLDKKGFTAALASAKGDAQAWKSGVEAMKLKGGALTGEGVGIGKWTELNSKIQVIGGGLRAVAGAAGGAARSLFKSELEFEKTVLGLAATVDGSETLRQELDALKEVAKMPGLGFQEAIDGTAALKGAKLSAVEAREALMALGNALAVSGKGKAELDDVIQALNSIVSQGVVAKDQTDILSTRIRGFSEMTSQIPKDNALEWVKSMIKALKQLPQAAETAQDKIDNLKDAALQKALDESGGKAAAGFGVLADAGGTALKQDWKTSLTDVLTPRNYVESYDKVAAALDMAAKFQPTPQELERRKKVRDDLAAAERKQKEAAERAAANAAAQAKAEEARAKQAEANAKLAATAPQREAAQQGLDVLRLRAAGRNKQADELERRQEAARRSKELQDAGMDPAQATAMADEESRLKKAMAQGRRTTYKGQSERGFTGIQKPVYKENRGDKSELTEEWVFPGLDSLKAMQSRNTLKPQASARAAGAANAAAGDPVSKAVTFFGPEIVKELKVISSALAPLAPLPASKLP